MGGGGPGGATGGERSREEGKEHLAIAAVDTGRAVSGERLSVRETRLPGIYYTDL